MAGAPWGVMRRRWTLVEWFGSWLTGDRLVWGMTLAAVGVSVAGVGNIVTARIPRSLQVHLLAINVVGSWCYLVAGLIARRRVSGSSAGNWMLAVGFAWLASTVRWALDMPGLVTAGTVLEWLWAALLVHLALMFPDGRLHGRRAALAVAAAYVVALPGRLVWIVLGDQRLFFAGVPLQQPVGCAGCPRSVISTGLAPRVASVISTAEGVAVAVVGVGVAVLLVLRWRSGSGPRRRALGPVLVTVLAAVLLTVTSTVATVAGATRFGELLTWLFDGAVLLVPFAFLVGLVWARLRIGAGLVGVFEHLSELRDDRGIEAALRDAIGDESLVIAYWLPDEGRFVTADGASVAVPDRASGREVTEVDQHGELVAVLIHDPSLAGDRHYVRACGRAAVLWLERARLEAERNARMVELRESRARLVEAADAERRRIERDLHDGAQQQLAGLLLQTKLRRRGAAADDTEALLDDLERGLAAALSELRALAAGILPPVLTDYGLPAALEELAVRTPVPVAIEAEGVARLPEPIEAAAYFVVAEALANVIKHAQARGVLARVERQHGSLMVEVADDGVGGASPARGTGLRGLTDRVTALNGRLECLSPPDHGTVVRAEIPCEW